MTRLEPPAPAAEEVWRQFQETDLLMLVRVAQDKALPFEIRVPNRETAATLAATDRGEDLVRCQDANELFAKLGL